MKKFTRKMKENDLEFVVVGSTNLKLHGLDIDPNDVDIALPIELVETFSEVFSDNITSFSSSNETSGSFVILNLVFEGMEFEVFGEEEGELYRRRYEEHGKDVVEFEGVRVPCLDLDLEKDCYSEIGKEERAKKIEKFIGNSSDD